jgi:hypothetical protein
MEKKVIRSALKGRGRTGRNLSPQFLAKQFKPGQSGNRTGNKGSTYGEVVQIARQYSEKAIRRLVELTDSDDERVAFMASQAVLDRAFGKPRVEEFGPPAGSDVLVKVRREAIRAQLVRMLDEKAAHTALAGR